MKKVRIVAVVLAVLLVLAEPLKLNAGATLMYGNPDMYKVTAYCPCKKCCGKSDGITASGTAAMEGRTVAVDPDVIPYGSTLLIYYDYELVGIYIAEDCGGAIKGKRVDLYFDSHDAALKWGVKECEVYVLPDCKG